MKILMVSSYLPYPLHSGGHIRLYNLLKRLKKSHDITLVCEKRSYQSQEDIDRIKEICRKLIVVPRAKQWSISNILRTGFSKKPFLLTGHSLPQMRNEIKKLLEREKFNLIHVETFYVAQNLPNTQLPVVIAEHNIEYDVYRRYADRAQFFLKPFLNLDIFKLKLVEETTWENSDAMIAVSNQDRQVISRFNKNVYLVPNGVDLDKFKFENGKRISKNEKTVLYIGDFKWVQNRDAVEFILEKIWPQLMSKIKSQKLKVKLWIVGKNIPEYLKNIGGENVFFDENAPEDASEIFKKSDVLLAPVRVGGGTSYKILEAMASGVPVVTTKLGAAGLLATHQKELIIADSESQMIDGVNKLISDEIFYAKIQKNARGLIEKNYDWETIVRKLKHVYKLAVSTRY